MRRKGVPCGCTDNGGCCGLKEKLAILWDRTIGSILKINDQTPDGDGNFEIRAGSNVTISDISNGIEISAVGGSAEDVVKSVNGELPDEDGEVTVDVGVRTVNSIAPDSDGDFTISAGTNVTITPTANGVEIEAEGGNLTAQAPLQIVNGEISLKGWTLYTTSTDWTVFKDNNNVTTEDLFIWLYDSTIGVGSVFVPKGLSATAVGAPSLDIQKGASNSSLFLTNVPLNQILTAGNNVGATYYELAMTTVGSEANEVINFTYMNAISRNVPKRLDASTDAGIRLYVRA